MTVYCSFCGAPQHNVRQLVQGNEIDGQVAHICNECIVLSVSALFNTVVPDNMMLRLNKWIEENAD